MNCPYCHMPIPNEQRMAELDAALASVKRARIGPLVGNEKHLNALRTGPLWPRQVKFKLGDRVQCSARSDSKAARIGTVVGYSRSRCWILKDGCSRAYPFDEWYWEKMPITNDNEPVWTARELAVELSDQFRKRGNYNR